MGSKPQPLWLPLLLLFCLPWLSEPLGKQTSGLASNREEDNELLVRALNGLAIQANGKASEDLQWDGGGPFSAFAGSASKKVQAPEHVHQEKLAGSNIHRHASAGPLPAPPPHADRLGLLRDAAPLATTGHLPREEERQPDERPHQVQAEALSHSLLPQQPPIDPALMIRLAARNDLLRDGRQAVSATSFRRLLQTCECSDGVVGLEFWHCGVVGLG
jgi:hypothetical protein